MEGIYPHKTETVPVIPIHNPWRLDDFIQFLEDIGKTSQQWPIDPIISICGNRSLDALFQSMGKGKKIRKRIKFMRSRLKNKGYVRYGQYEIKGYPGPGAIYNVKIFPE
jgi:hypothetical protein